MISIIIPTFNRSQIISKTLDSVKNQSLHDWECIVVDDGSTDNTASLISTYIKNDPRFLYINNNRFKGAQGARNTGILAAHGDWVVLFDSDNIMHPDFLRKVYDAVKHDNCDACGCFSRVLEFGTERVIGSFKWSGYGSIHSSIMRCISYFDNSSTLIRRQKLLEIGLLDEHCPAYQEWDTHIRLSNISNYTTVEEELIDYYQGGDDTISKSLEKDIRGMLFIFKKYKREWLLKYPKVYLFKLYNTYCNLQQMKGDKHYVDLKNLYNDSANFFFNCIVSVLYRIKKA